MKIGFLPALALLFIGLKLCNVIAWPWWLVLMPLWIGFAVVAAIVISTVITCVTLHFVSRNRRK